MLLLTWLQRGLSPGEVEAAPWEVLGVHSPLWNDTKCSTGGHIPVSASQGGGGRALNRVTATWNEDPLSFHTFPPRGKHPAEWLLANDFPGDVMVKFR